MELEMIEPIHRDFLVLSTQNGHLDAGYPMLVVDLDGVLHLQERLKVQVRFRHWF
jgi:hypothetical protein